MEKDNREELELEEAATDNDEEAVTKEEEDVTNGEEAVFDEDEETPKKKSKKKWLLLIPVVLILFVIIFAALFINHKLNLIHYGTGLDYTLNTNNFVENEEDKVDFGEIDDVTGKDYMEILKNWALNSDAPKLSDKNVINVLLIGSDASALDSHRADVMENGNTDVMMLVSVNTKNKTIKLVSFMRDSYTYLKGYDRFAKLNAACANGGPAYLVDVIEDNYKIEIDGYAMVDFDTFIQCIDIVGGVTVDVPDFIGKKYNMPYGNGVTLDGQQALNFCRERHSYKDGDVSRTGNQRKVINALIEKSKSASLSKINSMLDIVLANVHTSFGKEEIKKYMKSAISDNWASFTVTQRTMPTADARYGYSGSAWIWVIDYPLAAQKLQNELYGTTNIKLDSNRKTAITIMGGYVTEDKGN